MTALGDGAWVEAGTLEAGTLVLIRETVGGIAMADPAEPTARWGTVVSVDHRACDGEPCVRFSVDRDGPGCWFHVTADRELWATQPW